MKALSLKNEKINLGNLKTQKAFDAVNEENFLKLKTGNVLDKEGASFEDYQVNDEVIRKIFPTWLTSGRLVRTGINII